MISILKVNWVVNDFLYFYGALDYLEFYINHYL